MKRDSIFYRLFETFPESFFDLLNLPPETVNHYQFSSLEVKQLAFRLDGVFLPDNLNDPIYFVEVQFQKDERFYSRFFSEIFLYFHQSELSQNWQGVIIYPHREIENSPKSRYQEFFESGRVNCYYLNQLDEGDSLGVKVLQLIVESEQKTLEQGKELIQQVRQQFQESLKRQDILELIETILIYKLPKLNRKEIEKMFSLSDLRETKVYQEALEEGKEEGELSAKKSLILRQLNLKLGSIPLKLEQKIKQLNPNQLDNLALALLNFSDLEDLQQWLN
ncbi:MAG: Rpn family recombination-promoting nuclease/putative transposase [Microcystis sp.]|uniref:Rpn family recombination-promoting nuclease/putative transposase n=1 Tax=Microcystis TaxID=1125 RepID=UPI0016813A64|nr:Rpn family recombination-promoting nuclease/putative transposase [Microcystis aeruginosa]MBD2290609.1 Rpn family recombination-promoting nuclease/putative transposase [Microcystis wesenbergii FACHB-1317]UZO78783.1 Rpn family recombination-promoting nuclease/putative transposase [Microcystis aeruginosa str. Chao 1910]